MLPLKTIVEGVLFAAETPLDAEKLHATVEGEATLEEVREAVRDLKEEYDSSGRAFILREVGGGYQFRTRPEVAMYCVRLRRRAAARMSRAAMETLAVVAYRQPVIRSEIDKIRGVDSGGVLRALLEKDLIRVASREEKLPGRPILYATTQRFLETFDLEDLNTLPTIEEMDKLAPPAEPLGPKLF
ncbi:MAG: SMC-Scp complex subunit ScpB [Deltaproteobacteria bacterium]|jgi:segregation and condensation protein B|nr:SMC-Scp complex subunit ScpB [Deltaproteobacteria bacterium]